MDVIIKIVKLLEDSGLLIDCAIEIVKHETKKQECGFLGAIMAPIATSLIAPMPSSLIQPMTSSWININAISGKGVMRPGKDKKVDFFHY